METRPPMLFESSFMWKGVSNKSVYPSINLSIMKTLGIQCVNFMSPNSSVAAEWKQRHPHRAPAQEECTATFQRQHLQLGKLENNADILLKFSANGVVSNPNWKIKIRVSLSRKENAFLSLTRARGSVTRH